MWKKYKTHIISILIAFGVGGLSAFITSKNMNLYEEIIMPPLSPPSILFPIVWTILYLLMGISSAMIYNQKETYPKEARKALTIYAINLFLNFTWSIIFFNLRAFFFSFSWLLLLWATILTMIVKFYNIKPIASYLQIPYLLWVTFAGYLNLSIFFLNWI